MARPPSKEAHAKVLDAALQLIAERGIEATTMDAIAAASGVSKATVYKHWANKDELLLEVIRNLFDKLPEFESADPRQDLIQLLQYLAQSRRKEELGRILPRVASYAAANPSFANALRFHAFAPRRDQIRRIIERAEAIRELREGVDPDLATDLLLGPLMHRRFSQETVPAELPERVVDYFWEAFRRRK